MPEFILDLGDSESHQRFDALPEFAQGFITAAFFTGVDTGDGESTDGEETPGIDALSPDDLNRLATVAAQFHLENLDAIREATESGSYTLEQAGTDFWFTGGGYGVGYSDRDLGDVGDTLDAAALYQTEGVHLYLSGESVYVDGLGAGFTPEEWANYFDATEQPQPGGLGDVGGRFGAPMGRRGTLHAVPPQNALQAVRVTLDSGGYDAGGAYWGLGEPLWRVFWPAHGVESFQRGKTKEAAIQGVKDNAARAVRLMESRIRQVKENMERAPVGFTAQMERELSRLEYELAAAKAPARLEEIRAALNAESVSLDDLAELESLAAHIPPGDVQLLEAAGVPEHEESTDAT